MTHCAAEQQSWNHHWRALVGERRLFGQLASAVRKLLLARAVRHYTNRFFANRGLFVEAGCGSAESSARIRRLERKLVGVDFSLAALRLARQQRVFDGLLCADIRRLPFRDSVLAGLWNLGVMEHFAPAEARRILDEFHRVMKPRAAALLFWPPTFGLSRWALAPVEWTRSRLAGKEFRFFPDEVNRLPSRRAARQALQATGFEPVRLDFNARDGFTHLVVVARRSETRFQT
ncbi:MAG TPA: class I SAM-dependent methyltransferase [Thermoanaerobaculia bacterium]|nr:class I SAM-dependent methyltransferase [Thermoanaerobaculia bacterium]